MIRIYIVSLFLFFSCKEISKSPKVGIKANTDFINQSLVSNQKSKISNDIIGGSTKLMLEQEIDSSFNNLFDRELIGLSIRDEYKNEGEYYKKYWIDFNSICMCDSPSIIIDESNKAIYVYNYCKDFLPPDDREFFYEYEIQKKELEKGNLKITTFNKSEEDIIFRFIKSEDDIYKLIVEGNLPTSYIGGRLNQFFTPFPDEFEKEDCGDFDG